MSEKFHKRLLLCALYRRLEREFLLALMLAQLINRCRAGHIHWRHWKNNCQFLLLKLCAWNHSWHHLNYLKIYCLRAFIFYRDSINFLRVRYRGHHADLGPRNRLHHCLLALQYGHHHRIFLCSLFLIDLLQDRERKTFLFKNYLCLIYHLHYYPYNRHDLLLFFFFYIF